MGSNDVADHPVVTVSNGRPAVVFKAVSAVNMPTWTDVVEREVLVTKEGSLGTEAGATLPNRLFFVHTPPSMALLLDGSQALLLCVSQLVSPDGEPRDLQRAWTMTIPPPCQGTLAFCP